LFGELRQLQVKAGLLLFKPFQFQSLGFVHGQLLFKVYGPSVRWPVAASRASSEVRAGICDKPAKSAFGNRCHVPPLSTFIAKD
jgi:hypothetical protein